MEDKAPSEISFWSRLGPVLLLGSFAAILLKCAPLYWPFALTAFAGYATTLYLKKRGMFLSLFILAAVLMLFLRTGAEPNWPLLLTASIALSWLLIFWGGQEADVLQTYQKEMISSLEENGRALEKQLWEAKIAISKESKDLIAEKERLQAQLNQTRISLQNSDREKEKLSQKCETLSQDVFSHQRKEIAFQHALDDSQGQLLKLREQLAVLTQLKEEPVSNIIPMQENEPEDPHYANLRAQFEEKSESLDQARKELFKVENAFLTLQKQWEEKTLEVSEEDESMIRDLKLMEEECRELEAQVFSLQEFITALLFPKKKSARSKKSSKSAEDEEALPLLLQDKIDHISN